MSDLASVLPTVIGYGDVPHPPERMSLDWQHHCILSITSARDMQQRQVDGQVPVEEVDIIESAKWVSPSRSSGSKRGRGRTIGGTRCSATLCLGPDTERQQQ